MKRRSTAMNPVFIKDQNTQQLPTIKSEPEESSNLNSNSTNEGTDQNHQVISESKLSLKDETINSSNLHLDVSNVQTRSRSNSKAHQMKSTVFFSFIIFLNIKNQNQIS